MKNKKTNYDKIFEEEMKDNDFKENFDFEYKKLKLGYKINQIRKKEGISQKELAEKIDTAQGNISRIERGEQNVTYELLDKIAQALNRNINIEFYKKESSFEVNNEFKVEAEEGSYKMNMFLPNNQNNQIFNYE